MFVTSMIKFMLLSVLALGKATNIQKIKKLVKSSHKQLKVESSLKYANPFPTEELRTYAHVHLYIYRESDLCVGVRL